MVSTVIYSRIAGRRADSMHPLLVYAPSAIVLGAMTFNMFLCFVNTKVGGIGNTQIILCEAIVIFFTLCFAYPVIDRSRFLVISSALFYLICLAAARGALYGGTIQIKPARDLLIPIAFFLLGVRAGNVRQADQLVRVVAALFLMVGLIEYAVPDVFTNYLNVAKFYIERGSMALGQAQQSSNLFISGIRPEGLGGRNIFPFLGDHRVSSIFLEPVSAGNFGIIVFMWALVRSMQTRRVFWGMFAAAAMAIVLSDSRFGAMFCLIGLLIALLPLTVGTAAAALLPIVGLAGLIFLPDMLSRSHVIGNGFISRIILSGRFLSALEISNVLGIKTPNFTAFDSGYAYLLSGIGILGALGFWLMLWSIGGYSPQFKIFRNLAGAYYAVLLCVSNSPFTIKTASLLWFLTGVLSQLHERPARAPHPRKVRQSAELSADSPQ